IFATLPPRSVTMATGAAGGANHELGLRYRDILARSGVRLRLVDTTGGLDNLARLRDPGSGVQVGLIQGGTTTQEHRGMSSRLAQCFSSPSGCFTGVRSEATFGYSVAPVFRSARKAAAAARLRSRS